MILKDWAPEENNTSYMWISLKVLECFDAVVLALLQDACSNHFDDHNPITFLFDESIVALNFMRDAGFFEASRLWSLKIERQ